jgi:hypothetical protein
LEQIERESENLMEPTKWNCPEDKLLDWVQEKMEKISGKKYGQIL